MCNRSMCRKEVVLVNDRLKADRSEARSIRDGHCMLQVHESDRLERLVRGQINTGWPLYAAGA